MKGRCDNCGSEKTIDSVTVRMYTKRSQIEYRFRLCDDDRRLLDTLLEGTAHQVQRGFFDHRQGMTHPVVVPLDQKGRRPGTTS